MANDNFENSENQQNISEANKNCKSFKYDLSIGSFEFTVYRDPTKWLSVSGNCMPENVFLIALWVGRIIEREREKSFSKIRRGIPPVSSEDAFSYYHSTEMVKLYSDKFLDLLKTDPEMMKWKNKAENLYYSDNRYPLYMEGLVDEIKFIKAIQIVKKIHQENQRVENEFNELIKDLNFEVKKLNGEWVLERTPDKKVEDYQPAEYIARDKEKRRAAKSQKLAESPEKNDDEIEEIPPISTEEIEGLILKKKLKYDLLYNNLQRKAADQTAAIKIIDKNFDRLINEYAPTFLEYFQEPLINILMTSSEELPMDAVLEFRGGVDIFAKLNPLLDSSTINKLAVYDQGYREEIVMEFKLALLKLWNKAKKDKQPFDILSIKAELYNYYGRPAKDTWLGIADQQSWLNDIKKAEIGISAIKKFDDESSSE